jgi:nicotinamidase-related amidase
MSRSLRRHHAAKAKLRRIHIIWVSYWWRSTVPERPWRQLGRQLMNEPGWWVHDWMTVPARRHEKRFEHAIAHGLDPDAVIWPDNRKPHKYYW